LPFEDYDVGLRAGLFARGYCRVRWRPASRAG